MEKKKIKILRGILYLHSTKNNTIASISDIYGNILCWSSCGTVSNTGKINKKFKNTAKKTENAAFLAIKNVCLKGKKLGLKKIYISLKHYGAGYDVFLQAIKEVGLSTIIIVDKTPIAFNGCRAQKKRRRKRRIKNKEFNYVKVRYKK